MRKAVSVCITMLVFTILIFTILLPVPSGAYLYSVGPGEEFENIADVPWESLAAGDTVTIRHRTDDYHEKWVICRVGTETAPIVVRGIPSEFGELPVINGRDATTRPQLDFWNEERGVIKIGGANSPPDTMPAYIILENLEIRSGRSPYSFTGRYGLTYYNANCAAVYIEKGEHIVIRGCALRDCGNGLFCSHQTQDLVVEYNYIYENGIEGEIYEHNNYTEALGVLFQFNHFGPLRADCLGNNLKDRSAGTIVRYNWIESGNRQLDLVDSDHESLYNHPLYRRTFAYGNILIEPDGAGNSQIIHYGGDSGNTSVYRKGTLYLHNNTIVSTRSGNTTLMRLSTNDETCDCRNNIVYVTAAGHHLAMLAESGGVLHLCNNWLKSGWVACHGYTPGTIHNHGNVEGEEPGFMDLGDQLFELLEGSQCIDSGTSLDPEIADLHTAVMEYVKHALSRPRPDDGPIDIGAYEYAGAGSVLAENSKAGNRLIAHPNPFFTSVMIAAPASLEIAIYDLSGRLVWEPRTGGQQAISGPGGEVGAGECAHFVWYPDGSTPAGVYLIGAGQNTRSAYSRIIYLR